MKWGTSLLDLLSKNYLLLRDWPAGKGLNQKGGGITLDDYKTVLTRRLAEPSSGALCFGHDGPAVRIVGWDPDNIRDDNTYPDDPLIFTVGNQDAFKRRSDSPAYVKLSAKKRGPRPQQPDSENEEDAALFAEPSAFGDHEDIHSIPHPGAGHHAPHLKAAPPHPHRHASNPPARTSLNQVDSDDERDNNHPPSPPRPGPAHPYFANPMNRPPPRSPTLSEEEDENPFSGPQPNYYPPSWHFHG
jgi:hypothetical protein